MGSTPRLWSDPSLRWVRGRSLWDDPGVSVRSADDLAQVASPAWPEIVALAASSSAVVLPVEPAQGLRTLFRLQVSAGSFLGGLALNCGGILADHGWFRIYGGGSPGLPDVATANRLADPYALTSPPGLLEVGTDVLGGRFAIDGGALGINAGEVCYFGPDTLSWGGLGGGHSAFIRAVLDGSMADAFDSLRWPGWQGEVERLHASEGISLYPPPFTSEGKDPGAVSRRVVPADELRGFYQGAAGQLNT